MSILRTVRPRARRLVLISLCIASGAVGAAKLAQVLGTPTLSVSDPTQGTLDVRFTAGAPGGAPAGFSLQWVTADDLAANGGAWPSSDDARLCKASFSGQPGFNSGNFNRYSLAAGEQVTLRVGDILLDQGASTNCDQNLACGTTYAFRSFSHANSAWRRSEFSANATGTTLPCDRPAGCYLSQGYWKTHGPVPTGNNTNMWNTTTLTLGSVTYTDMQLQSILDAQPKGNGLIALAHQLIAVKLSVVNGADAGGIQAAVTQADALIGGNVIPPVGGAYLAPSQTNALTDLMDQYIHLNHCD